MKTTNTRRGFTQNCHAELVSASTLLTTTQNKEEILNQVQDDNRDGFTLIELLVVVLIIGILAAVAVPQYQVAVGKSKMLSALPLMRSILNAQQSYILANSTGTFNVNEIDIHFPYTKITGTSSTYSRRYHLDNQQYFIIYSAANRIIYAKHKKNDENSLEYAISLYKDGQGDCTFYNTTWEKICKSLSNSKLREDSTKTYDFSF